MIIQSRVFKAMLILLAGGALIVVLFLRFRETPEPSVDIVGSPYDGVVTVGDTRIPVSIADTKEEREQGLSGTESLTEGSGKLFVFETPGKYGFWMKDMKYDLDLVWIDAAFRIVGVTKHATVQSYPEVFYPEKQVLFVLEVNSGESAPLKLVPGATLTIVKND